MSHQQNIKRYRKEVRRRVDQKMGQGIEALRPIIRQRPKWAPKWLWVLLFLPLVKKEFLSIIYKYF